jgi:hypothetical protein
LQAVRPYFGANNSPVRVTDELKRLNTLFISDSNTNNATTNNYKSAVVHSAARCLLPQESVTVAGLTIHRQHAARTLRITQTLTREVELPIKNYHRWSRVGSLPELERRVDKAKSMGRMIIVVCSMQNESLWLPHAFHKVLTTLSLCYCIVIDSQ